MKLSEAIAALERGEEVEYCHTGPGHSWYAFDEHTYVNLHYKYIYRIKPKYKPRAIYYEVIATVNDSYYIQSELRQENKIGGEYIKTGRDWELIDGKLVPYVEGEK